MDGLTFDTAHLLAGGLVLVSLMLLYQDRLLALINVYALHALVLALSVAWQAHIQDAPHNRTRFAVIGHLHTTPSGHDQTSLVLAGPYKAGAVYNLLAPLATHGVSMTRFESRPARIGTWEYYFYVDVEGHANDAPVAKALAELKDKAAFFKLLGSYPHAL